MDPGQHITVNGQRPALVILCLTVPQPDFVAFEIHLRPAHHQQLALAGVPTDRTQQS